MFPRPPSHAKQIETPFPFIIETELHNKYEDSGGRSIASGRKPPAKSICFHFFRPPRPTLLKSTTTARARDIFTVVGVRGKIRSLLLLPTSRPYYFINSPPKTSFTPPCRVRYYYTGEQWKNIIIINTRNTHVEREGGRRVP